MITKLQVKYIQSLGQKKFRDEAGVFVAEGTKIINDLLGAGNDAPEVLYATPHWIAQHLNTLPEMISKRVVEVKEQELERLSFLQTPNQVLGVFKIPASINMNFSHTICLMLDGIQDPGNLGTIIRIADWFGIENIICSTDCADAYAPKVVQSTMGSIIRVNLFYTILPALVSEQKALTLYAAVLDGKSVNTFQPLNEGVIVIGNESKGISAGLLAACRHRITIPRNGCAESLNAAVATGIILSHLVGSNKP